MKDYVAAAGSVLCIDVVEVRKEAVMERGSSRSKGVWIRCRGGYRGGGEVFRTVEAVAPCGGVHVLVGAT